jgi:hypothetical protein
LFLEGKDVKGPKLIDGGEKAAIMATVRDARMQYFPERSKI